MGQENERDPGPGRAAFDQHSALQDQADPVFPKYVVASWKVGSSPERAFPAIIINESGENRIVERDRPYRDGAKLDDIGSRAKRWTIQVIFNNSVDEPDMSALNDNLPLYPDILTELIESFLQHETGDLSIPTVGTIRARASTYSRKESFDAQDEAMVSFTFIEDNEDALTAMPNPPTVHANATRLALQATFDVQSIGSWEQTLADLESLMVDIENLAAAPGEFLQDLDRAASQVLDIVDAAIRLLSNPGKPSRDTLTRPSGSRTERKLVRIKEMAGRALLQNRANRPRIQTVIVTEDTSLISISNALEQRYFDLLEINPQLENPADIPKGTTVKVFAPDA
jgi:prophage DNA circulation protein